ncbi:hypothetical protein [Curtobacterium sp. MCBD17_040]|uniref:hypothetical protein n=1 Tax=Curtobacterium sp. MCBD17_040 TaxID=2175674 RepID=UPI000DA8FDEE|nr:hypothetical protein [Curtobacterium sp. MCBD17_040]WIB65867.1 hypothetical protein DEI94_17280 [Curtobacterium sp. MCBD17_040]
MTTLADLRDAHTLLEDLITQPENAGEPAEGERLPTALVATICSPEVLRVLLHTLEDAVTQLTDAGGRLDSCDEPGAIYTARALALTLLHRDTTTR